MCKLMTADATPIASSLIETFRSIGYNFETALADIIDNSITAGASQITVSPQWEGGNSYLSVVDDGCGMTNEELIQAMVPGSSNPLASRSDNDLGRFGLGLKTASFSQCRCLSVISKKDGHISYWTWDLDHVAETNKWEITHWLPEAFENILDTYQSGTAVIWTKMDRVVNKDISVLDERMKRKFMNIMGNAELHLSMVFHKFIEKGRFVLIWGISQVKPWNPFCPSEEPTALAQEVLSSNLGFVKGYIMPIESHFSSPEAYEKAGREGWSSQQGFYVYRGNRMLVAATWLGIRKKELHTQLARIEIEIPNTLDEEWQIDIKKSSATPPAVIRDQLTAYARKVCSSSEDAFRNRRKGRAISRFTTYEPLWLESVNADNKWTFVINKKNAVIESIKEMAIEHPSKAIDYLIKIIEDTIPTRDIYIKVSENSKNRAEQSDFSNDETFKNIILTIFQNSMNTGLSKVAAINKLKNTEPFNHCESLIDEICQ